jgi:hypothetical protein
MKIITKLIYAALACRSSTVICYVPRTDQMNAWDNPAWVKAIEATKRITLLIAGRLTSVCMAFLTLSSVALAGTASVPASAAVPNGSQQQLFFTPTTICAQ